MTPRDQLRHPCPQTPGLSLVLVVSISALLSPSLSLLAAGPADAAASYALPTVMVTAEKRENDAQAVPASVTVRDDLFLEDFDVDNTYRLFETAPNIFMTRTGPPGAFTNFATVRGITSSMGNSPALGFFVDDVYYPGFDIGLHDVERAEVLRGPQGTLYGRNTEAGVINVVSKRPTEHQEASATAEYGSFGTSDLRAVLNTPLLDNRLLMRAAVRHKESEGWYETIGGDDDIGASKLTDGRLTLSSALSDGLDATLILDAHNAPSDHYLGFAPLNTATPRKKINVDYLGKSDKDARGGSLRIEKQFADRRLVSITAARDESSLASIDADFTPTDIFRLNIAKDVNLYSQEVRFFSDHPDAAWQWLLGAYLFAEDDARDYKTRLNFDNMGMALGVHRIRQTSRTKTLGTALFGEASYTFDSGLKLTAGLRWDQQRKDFDYRQSGGRMVGYPDLSGDADKTYIAWLPKLVLSYAFDDERLAYASVSRGFRSGGFNDNENLGAPYNSEFTLNYELGLNSSWLAQRLQLNLAVFQIDWTDRQVEVLTPIGTSFFIENAGEARSRGVELELTARPVPELDITSFFGYTDSKLTEYERAGQDLSGNQVTDSPEYTAGLAATYRLANGWFVNGAYRSVGRVYFDVANEVSQDRYEVVDAKVGYSGRHFEVALWGRNLSDEVYVTRAAPGAAGGWYGLAGEPRSIGLSASLYWN